ncbi:MAG: hypothetical protein AAB343_03200 [Patescibacteria group bacterium]
MKPTNFRLLHIKPPKITIPKAWSVFVVCAVIGIVVALAHDTWVFYQYGAGWQRNLETPPIMVQSFRESDLDAVLTIITERSAALERLRVEGVNVKNLFGEE